CHTRHETIPDIQYNSLLRRETEEVCGKNLSGNKESTRRHIQAVQPTAGANAE
ncbi:hypothetical protein CHS0354_003918, partial [Potamilus streckersoni]